MLTEGWDANTVTHILGVRAFGTQLLCEQVIGRALRRQSYDLNEDGLFNVEYADILGIPFDFTAKPVVAPPQPPRDTCRSRRCAPSATHLEIRFPRVEGYRVELPEERLHGRVQRGLRARTHARARRARRRRGTQGIIGEGVDLEPRASRGRPAVHGALPPHEAPALYQVARPRRGAASCTCSASSSASPKQWIERCLVCKGGTYPALLMYQDLADMACDRITAGITEALTDERPIKVLLDPYNPTGSTAHVRFTTSRTDRWETDPPPKSHVNWVILDSDWEAEFCRVVEAHPRVVAYTKNHDLGFEVPYRYGSESRRYLPDFIVLVDDGRGDEDLLHLVVEIKGYRREDAKEKKPTMETYWMPGVNNLGTYGRWALRNSRTCTRSRPSSRRRWPGRSSR